VPTLREITDRVHGWYPPGSAEAWDAVGLVAGDPDRSVAKVMFAVDPTGPVAVEAAAWGADLLVVHHPLFLKPVHGVARTTPKARALGVLQDAGCALLTAHTNADGAIGGVSESLALALGLGDLSPLAATHAQREKLTVYVPGDGADAVREALAGSGAGRIGAYDSASFSSAGRGRFRPLAGASPAIGEIGRLESVDEVRIEVVLDPSLRGAVVAAMLAAHPYEEPAYDVVALQPAAGDTGAGRIGTIEPTTLADFAAAVSQALPATGTAIRIAGDPARAVRRVAVCGGAGDFLLDTVLATDADVYVTSDLRHHPAAEFTERGGALIDVPHWAAEWTWLPVVADRLRAACAGSGDTVETRVSEIVTDPWTTHLPHVHTIDPRSQP
jgi:dinuclear metal center YbgI/SA1388 family protein